MDTPYPSARHLVDCADCGFRCLNHSAGLEVLTFVMGLLHDGTLLPMPLYFFVLSTIMLIMGCALLRQKDK
jgi:hypothetical protein